jgi:hypothetical protein
MNKLLYAFTAGVAAVVLTSGIALSADKTRPSEEPAPRASENQPGDPGSVTTGNEKAQHNDNEEYMAALKKCDSMKPSKKQMCVDAADRKYRDM